MTYVLKLCLLQAAESYFRSWLVLS